MLWRSLWAFSFQLIARSALLSNTKPNKVTVQANTHHSTLFPAFLWCKKWNKKWIYFFSRLLLLLLLAFGCSSRFFASSSDFNIINNNHRSFATCGRLIYTYYKQCMFAPQPRFGFYRDWRWSGEKSILLFEKYMYICWTRPTPTQCITVRWALFFWLFTLHSLNTHSWTHDE